MQTITEHSSKIRAILPKKDVHAGMEIFYNPKMVSNRNISVLLLNSIENKNMNIALPLAGSGIRGLRFLQELKRNKVNHLFINDKKEDFIKYFKGNLKLNKLKNNITITNQEASLFLLNQVNDKNKPDKFCGYFDYIDIDPFGTPNPFLNAAIARISREGIIAVTATDTAALSGTYENVTKRKYWAKPLRNYLMHEIGLRILIRKVQLLGVQFDKALTPILSYHKDHYFRVYFRNEKGKQKCDEILKQHNYFLFCHKCLNYKTSIFNKEKCKCKNEFVYAGPLWVGKLFDRKLLKDMVKNNKFEEENKFLKLLYEESSINVPGFIDLHEIAKKEKKDPGRIEGVLKKTRGVRTHFSKTGIKARSLHF